MAKILVKRTHGVIGKPDSMRKVLWALGLRKVGAERELPDNNCTRGMINKVRHLVTYELKK